MSNLQSERSPSFRPEVLVVNQPAPTPEPNRSTNVEAYGRSNLSLDSAPPSLRPTKPTPPSSPPLYSDMRCPLCPSTTMLLDENMLMGRGVISFVQLQPCGHAYCTRCFESLLLASATTSHTQAILCTAPMQVNGHRSECRRELLVPKAAVTQDKVVVETRECRFETPSGNFLNTCELRLSLLDQRETIAPGHVVIKSSQALAEAQAEPDVLNSTSPAWVLMAMTTHLERLWQLVRERRTDGRLFRKVVADARVYDQPATIRHILNPNPFPNGLPPRGYDQRFIYEAGTFAASDPAHTGTGLRNEAAITNAAPPPPLLNPPRNTSSNLPPPDPNAQPVHITPDNFAFRRAPPDVEIRAPAVPTGGNVGHTIAPQAGIAGGNIQSHNYSPDVNYVPNQTRAPARQQSLSSAVYSVDFESLTQEFVFRTRESLPTRGRPP